MKYIKKFKELQNRIKAFEAVKDPKTKHNKPGSMNSKRTGSTHRGGMNKR